MPVIVSREALMRLASHAWNSYPSAAYGFLLGRTETIISVSLPAWTFPGDRESTVGRDKIEERLAIAKNLAASLKLYFIGDYGSLVSEESMAFLRFSKPAIFLDYDPICCKSHSSAGLSQEGKGNLEWCIHGSVRENNSVNQKRVISRWHALIGSAEYYRLVSSRRTKA